MDTRTVKIFLASSAELRADRDAFKLNIARRNDAWAAHGVRLEVLAWETFLDAMSQRGLQQEYNRAIQQCDIFVMLFWTKVGRYTLEEFNAAFGQFKASGKPFIFTYYKQASAAGDAAADNAADRASLAAFQDTLKALGHYQTVYDGDDGLNLHFVHQLDQLVAKGFIEFSFPREGADAPDAAIYQARMVGAGAIAQGPGAVAVAPGATYIAKIELLQPAFRPRPSPPFQAPPSASDHVPRDSELAALRALLLDQAGDLRPVTVGLHGFGGFGKTTLARLLCADPQLRHACRDGILWAAIGTHPTEPRLQLAEWVVALTGQSEACATTDGARSQLQAALAGRQVLLVLDDVWNEAHIKDLLDASQGCARLITTRKPSVLPFDAQRVKVASTNLADSKRLLALGLPAGQTLRLESLAARLGHWPVLLRLANRSLREHLAQGLALDQALDEVGRHLGQAGAQAFDPDQDALGRDQAVAATVEASLALLTPSERQRCAELAIFPQGLPIPLARAAELWRISAALDEHQSRDLVARRLDPLSLLDYDAGAGLLRLHDVLHQYLGEHLDGRADLHQRLAEHWTGRPTPGKSYAWRWLAYHRAQAVIVAAERDSPDRARQLLDLVTDGPWQQAQQAALKDLTALRDALAWALDAAAAVSSAAGLPLLVRAADALLRFTREHERAAPIFELAQRGELDAARGRCELFSLDPQWRQTLHLAVAWLAPPSAADAAIKLYHEVRAELAPEPALAALADWVGADLVKLPQPVHAGTIDPSEASPHLIEQILLRLGGAVHDREALTHAGLSSTASNPDMATRGLARPRPGATADDPGSPTQYLAEQDGPYLVAHAVTDHARGIAALLRYLSVFANYGYAEYRFSSCWMLLAAVVQFAGAGGKDWVRDAVKAILETALGGGRVDFESSLSVAVQALAARAGDACALAGLTQQGQALVGRAQLLMDGRDAEASDLWGHHKRAMLAHAEALGWLLGDGALADKLIVQTSALARSGFAGYQAPACLTLAESIRLIRQADQALPDADIELALAQAQSAAHNVQDPHFCARSTARVNAMRRHWWTEFDLQARALRLPEASDAVEFAALHRVGHRYEGRENDSLPSPAQQYDDHSLRSLQWLYKRRWDDIARLNDVQRVPQDKDEVAVPDPGLQPLIAARLAAEVLAQADGQPISPQLLAMLRSLVAHALTNPTALDSVLSRLVLAHSRRATPVDPAEAAALRTVLDQRVEAAGGPAAVEPLTRVPAAGLPH